MRSMHFTVHRIPKPAAVIVIAAAVLLTDLQSETTSNVVRIIRPSVLKKTLASSIQDHDAKCAVVYPCPRELRKTEKPLPVCTTTVAAMAAAAAAMTK